MSPPPPLEQPGWKYHAAPKPLAANAVTHDWACFLGPSHNGVSTEKPLLGDFGPAGPPLVWEVQRGTGYCAPAIANGRLVLFHRVDDEEVVECLDAETGKRFWRFAYPTAYKDPYGYCNGPRASPVIDGDWVYTYGAEGKLHCLRLATGQLRWRRDISDEFHLLPAFFGVGCTPLIEGELLIVNVGAPLGPCVAAFDKLNGRMAWGAGEKWGASYASPIPAVVHGLRRVFVFAGGKSQPPLGGLLCIDPTNGAVDFEYSWRGRRYESVNASSPVIIGNQVFISECYGRGGALLDLAAKDGAIRAATNWIDKDFGTHFMTAIAKDGYLYGVHGHGPLDTPFVCAEIKTGKEMWRSEPEWEETFVTNQGPLQRTMGPARASLILADGRFLCLGEYGHLMWLELTPQGYRQRCRAWLFSASETWTAPVLSHGLLYICQNTRDARHNQPPRLLCYDLRGR